MRRVSVRGGWLEAYSGSLNGSAPGLLTGWARREHDTDLDTDARMRKAIIRVSVRGGLLSQTLAIQTSLPLICRRGEHDTDLDTDARMRIDYHRVEPTLISLSPDFGMKATQFGQVTIRVSV